MGDLIAPLPRLPIALFQRGKAAPRPKRFPYIANGSFHPAFLIAGAHLARPGGEVVMGAQFHQARVEVDLVAPPFQYRTAEIVVENDPWLSCPSLEGVDM